MNPFQMALKFFRLKSEWLGDGGEPVSVAQAQTRTNTCLGCPMNNSRLWELLAEAVAEHVKEQVEYKNKLSLFVEDENRLHICDGCDCVLKLKVFVPLVYILKTTDLSKLHPGCWILAEHNK